MTLPVSGEQHEKSIEAACEGACDSARERGWRGNDAEAWPLRNDAAKDAVAAYFDSLAAQGVRLVDVREVAEWLARERDVRERVAFLARFGGGDG